MKKEKKEEPETIFRYRAYGKSELALLYMPYIQPDSAVKQLKRWIALKPGLSEALHASGLTPNAKQFNPAQVRLITDALGEP